MVFKPVLVGFILLFCVVGLIGNIMAFLIIFLLKEYKKSVTHWYILQLAVADTLFLATIPFQAQDNLLGGKWPFGNGMCKAFYGIRFINYYASVLFLMVMSIDRYLAVQQDLPQKLKKLRNVSAVLVISLVVWIVSILFSIPMIYYSVTVGNFMSSCQCKNEFFSDDQHVALCYKKRNDYEYCKMKSPKDEGLCKYIPEKSVSDEDSFESGMSFANFPFNESSFGSGSNSEMDTVTVFDDSMSNQTIDISIIPHLTPTGKPPLWVAYVCFNFIVMFILPMLVMSLCYGIIIKKFKLTRGAVQSRVQTSNAKNDMLRLTITCFTLVATFFVSWIMYHVVLLVGLYRHLDNEIISASVALIFLNSALDPYLYSFLGPGCNRKMRMIRENESVKRVISTKSRKTNMMSFFQSQEKSKYGTVEIKQLRT